MGSGTISIIVARTPSGVIGHKGGLPWHVPEDLRRFKEITLGKVVVMGRTTYESLPCTLRGRRLVVLTRDSDYRASGAILARSGGMPALLKRLKRSQAEVIVAGGASIYQQALPFADRIYLTEIHQEYAGETYFPWLNPNEWREVSREDGDKCTFVTLERSSEND